MNQKIPLRRMAEALAVRLYVTPEQAEDTLKLFFGQIADTLRTGRSVRIKGFGEFSLTSSPDDPVAFTPEAVWADEVNAPFAMFSAVAVAPGLDSSDFDAVGAAESMPEPEPQAAPQPEPAPVPASEPIPEPEPVAEPEPAPQPEPAPAPSPALAPEPKAPLRWPDEEEEEAEEAEESVSEIEAEMPRAEGGSFRTGFIVGLIIGLAIGALALCAYVLYYVNADSAPQPVETELVETEAFPAL